MIRDGDPFKGVIKTRRWKVTSWSEVFGIDMMEPSLPSNLATLTRIPPNIIQWRRSWFGGRQSISISMVSNAMINGKKISICSFCRWHAREGSPGQTHDFELTHGRKNEQTYFTRVGQGRRSNRNRDCKIVLQIIWIYSPQQDREPDWHLASVLGLAN